MKSKTTSGVSLSPVFLTVAIITAVFSTVACASPSAVSKSNASKTTEEDADRLFEVLDVDGNGRISRQEAKSGLRYLISSYDRGGKSELLAAKPGQSENATVTAKKKSKRRPSDQDAQKAFEAMFDESSKASNEISKDQFKKMVVKSSDNPDTDPFAAFM